MNQELWIVLAAFSEEKTINALHFCNRVFYDVSRAKRCVVLNNASLKECPGVVNAFAGWNVIAGSNRQYEFSAWQEGVDLIRQRSTNPFSVIFINDTVSIHRHLSIFRKLALKRAIKASSGAQIVGVTHIPGEASFSVAGLSLSAWVSTFVFFLTAEALSRLDYTICDQSLLSRCVRGGVDEEYFFTSEVSDELRKHLCRWLFHGGWYASEDLSLQSEHKLSMKAKSIISEKWLSARCEALGILRVDPFEAYPELIRTELRIKRLKARTRQLFRLE